MLSYRFFTVTTTSYKISCELSSLLLSDSEHDVWSGAGAAASKRGAGQEDCSSGRETGLHPSQCAIAACCAFSSNNKAAKRFPGWSGMPCPLPVILPELWLLFSLWQAALSWIHPTKDVVQLIGLAQCAALFMLGSNSVMLCYTFKWLHTSNPGSYSYSPILSISKEREEVLLHTAEGKNTISSPQSFPVSPGVRPKLHKEQYYKLQYL